MEMVSGQFQVSHRIVGDPEVIPISDYFRVGGDSPQVLNPRSPSQGSR